MFFVKTMVIHNHQHSRLTHLWISTFLLFFIHANCFYLPGVAPENKATVLSAHFRAYIQALERLQMDIATSSDLIGVEARVTSLFSRRRKPLKNRSAVLHWGRG